MALENFSATVSYYLPIIEQHLREFYFATKERTITILQAPLNDVDMLWILIPLILTMVLLEFYFGRYKEEELGWNTAFGNSLVLIFVSVYLARYLYTNNLLGDKLKLTVIATLITFGLVITLVDFFHLLPKNLAFGISSKIPLNFLAYVSIILVYTNIPLDEITISAFLAILIGLFILVGIIHSLTPKTKDPEEEEILSKLKEMS